MMQKSDRDKAGCAQQKDAMHIVPGAYGRLILADFSNLLIWCSRIIQEKDDQLTNELAR